MFEYNLGKNHRRSYFAETWCSGEDDLVVFEQQYQEHLEEVNLETRDRTWLMPNGAPSHFSYAIKVTLIVKFEVSSLQNSNSVLRR